MLWFRDGTDERFARRIIAEWNLTVFSYAPADVYLLARGSEMAMVSEYDFGGERLPLITDLREASECALDKLTAARVPTFFQPWDVLLTGYKDSDEHWTIGNTRLFEEDSTVGHARVYAPLRHMSDAQVMSAIAEMHLPYEVVDDELPICTRCMEQGDTNKVWCPKSEKLIPREQWEQSTSLTAFRKRFQLENANG